jgi:hypothetical protein
MCAALHGIAERPLAAQQPPSEVRGTVTDSAAGRPVSGSVVLLLNAAGQTLTQTLTDARGQFRATRDPSAVRLRVLHIGYRPSVVALTASDTGPLTIRLALLTAMLSAIEVRDNPDCAPRRDRAAAYALWEQVRQGMLATMVARDASPARLKVLRYQRYLEGISSRITSQDVNVHTVASNARPFLAVRSAGAFVDSGFVGAVSGARTFFAPDADVIADEGFNRGYCFRIANPDREKPTAVGLGFSPAKAVAGRVDVDGTVWVDTAARELRSIEFRYVGLERDEQSFRPGGHLDFRRMPNGSVLIDRWGLRLVALRYDTTVVRTGDLRVRAWWEVHEAGGELANAHWADGSEWQASLGALLVDAKNRDGTPAAGAPLSLQYTDYRGRVDESGEFEARDLLPGPYTLIVNDSAMARIDLALPTTLSFTAVRDSVHLASVVVPTAFDYAVQQCREPKGGGDAVSAAVVAIFVYVVTPDGHPLDSIEMQIAETNPANPELSLAMAPHDHTDSGGRFKSCWRFVRGREIVLRVSDRGTKQQETVFRPTTPVYTLKVIWNPRTSP